jgi:hypothetical protein
VQLLSSEANEIATKEKKNTITPEHLLKAIRDLGFTDFIEEVTATMEQHKEESKGEMLSWFMDARAQADLRQPLCPTASSSHRKEMKKTGADREGLSEEEQIRIQQEMFAAARLRSMGSQALPALPLPSAAPVARTYQPPQQQVAGLGEGGDQMDDGDDLEEIE